MAGHLKPGGELSSFFMAPEILRVDLVFFHKIVKSGPAYLQFLGGGGDIP